MLFLPNRFYLKRIFRLEVNKTHQKISSSRIKLSPIHPQHPAGLDCPLQALLTTGPSLEFFLITWCANFSCKHGGPSTIWPTTWPSFQPYAPGPCPYFSLKESAHPCVSLLSLPPPTESSQQWPLFQRANSKYVLALSKPLSAKIPSTTAHFLLQLHNQAIQCVCGLWKQRE